MGPLPVAGFRWDLRHYLLHFAIMLRVQGTAIRGTAAAEADVLAEMERADSRGRGFMITPIRGILRR